MRNVSNYNPSLGNVFRSSDDTYDTRTSSPASTEPSGNAIFTNAANLDAQSTATASHRPGTPSFRLTTRTEGFNEFRIPLKLAIDGVKPKDVRALLFRAAANKPEIIDEIYRLHEAENTAKQVVKKAKDDHKKQIAYARAAQLTDFEEFHKSVWHTLNKRWERLSDDKQEWKCADAIRLIDADIDTIANAITSQSSWTQKTNAFKTLADIGYTICESTGRIPSDVQNLYEDDFVEGLIKLVDVLDDTERARFCIENERLMTRLRDLIGVSRNVCIFGGLGPALDFFTAPRVVARDHLSEWRKEKDRSMDDETFPRSELGAWDHMS